MIFSVWVIKNGQFQFLVTFLAVFFWYVNCTNLVCISSYFEHRQCFIWGFLIFSFLVFTNFSWSGNVSVLVCKLYFYFGHVQNLGQYLCLSVFRKQWKCPTFCFFKYILYRHFTQNGIFLYFLEAKILVLWWKVIQNLLIFVYLFCPKKQHNWFYENLHDSGMVGRTKLSDLSLNCIFNALSIGVQYTLLFQRTNFDLNAY